MRYGPDTGLPHSVVNHDNEAIERPVHPGYEAEVSGRSTTLDETADRATLIGRHEKHPFLCLKKSGEVYYASPDCFILRSLTPLATLLLLLLTATFHLPDGSVACLRLRLTSHGVHPRSYKRMKNFVTLF